jgi:hypothetical protein
MRTHCFNHGNNLAITIYKNRQYLHTKRQIILTIEALHLHCRVSGFAHTLNVHAPVCREWPGNHAAMVDDGSNMAALLLLDPT